MTAKIYSPPEELPMPQYDYSKPFKEEEKKEREWIEKLRKWCEKHGSGKYAGKIIQEPVADGCAQYMVFSLRPLELIHLPIGDAWQFRWAERWTASDVRQLVDRHEAMAKLFAQRGLTNPSGSSNM